MTLHMTMITQPHMAAVVADCTASTEHHCGVFMCDDTHTYTYINVRAGNQGLQYKTNPNTI